MKNKFKYLLIISLGVMLFTSCEEDPITLEQKIVGFSNSSGNLNEISSAPIGIPIYNGATSGSGCTVSFSFVTEGITNPAIEGTDFTLVNATKSLTFSSNFQTDTIFILPIDNSLYEGNKKVSIVLDNPTNGFILTNESTYTLNIVDDEHPLAAWIGTFDVDAYSNLNPGTWDEVWVATTEPNPDDVNQLLLTGIANGTVPVAITFNVDNMTVTFDAGSDIGDPYDWATCGIYGYNAGADALILSGPIEGTIENDGTIVFPYMVIAYSGNPSAYVWDVFTPTFTKR